MSKATFPNRPIYPVGPITAAMHKLHSFYNMGSWPPGFGFSSKKKRLRRNRWPRAVCTKCGALRWHSLPSQAQTIYCFRRYCHEYMWRIPSLEVGFTLAKVPVDRRATFAKLNFIRDRVTG